MSTTKLVARDAFFKAVTDAFVAACAVVTATPNAMRYQGKVEDVPAAGTYWARASMNNVLGGRTNIGAVQQGDGTLKRRHTQKGVLFVQMFAPMSVKGSEQKLQAIGESVKNALARPNSSGTVWLRNLRVNDLTPDDTNHRLNVVADYEYDELV